MTNDHYKAILQILFLLISSLLLIKIMKCLLMKIEWHKVQTDLYILQQFCLVGLNDDNIFYIIL